MGDDLHPTPPPNFRWITPSQLAGSGRPHRAEHILWVAEEGIRAIVSTIPLHGDVLSTSDRLGLEHLYLPVEDFGVPSDAQVERYLQFVDDMHARQRPVLVHCAAGIGRTGTLCALWLVHRGRSAREALDLVGVESPPQRILVERWEDRTLS